MPREELFRKIIQLLKEEAVEPEKVTQTHVRCLAESNSEDEYSACMEKRLSEKELKEELEL
jgi:hypothetical protein